MLQLVRAIGEAIGAWLRRKPWSSDARSTVIDITAVSLCGR